MENLKFTEDHYRRAEIAYAGYCRQTGGKSLATGDMLPPFSGLRREIKDAWAAAVVAVLRDVKESDLSQTCLPDVELVAAKVHGSWMEGKRAKGITSRKAEDGEELMVPYAQLSGPQKDQDRNTVLAVYRAIESCQN